MPGWGEVLAFIIYMNIYALFMYLFTVIQPHRVFRWFVFSY